MRILQIEDDPATAQSVELMLRSEGMNVYSTDLGEEGIDLGKMYDYDLILLDLNLPDISGYDVLKTLRASKVDSAIMILSGLAGIEDKVKGLSWGADDYMTKPFHKEELVARIHALVRRCARSTVNVIDVGALTLDIRKRKVMVHGSPVHLSPSEYTILELLVIRRGRIVSRQMAMDHLYGGMDEPDIKIMDVIMCKIRQKLDVPGLIETAWGQGYRLDEPVRGVA